MAEITGYYYLHENGDLIYKPYDDGRVSDFRDSPFVRAFWPIDKTDRKTAWTLLVEALAAGANTGRVRELAKLWGCSDNDAKVYAGLIGVKLEMDGDQWCATPPGFQDLQASKSGFGKTCLEALVALAKDLGYRPAKMWGASFEMLLGKTGREILAAAAIPDPDGGDHD